MPLDSRQIAVWKGWRRTVCFGFVTAICLILGAVPPTAAWAGPPGVDRASPHLVKRMVVDLNVTNPARCQDAQLARSDRSWAIFSLAPRLGPKCTPYDGFSVIRKQGGTWKTTGIGGSSFGCALFKKALRQEGAPESVFLDFRAAGACLPGVRSGA